MVKHKKKYVWLVISSIIFITLAVGIPFLVLFILNNQKLESPLNLKIYAAGEYVYASVDESPKAVKYLFSLNDTTIIESDTNIINLTLFINELGEYKIKGAQRGKGEGSLSSYTNEISYFSFKKLQTPILEYNEITNSIIWNNILDAESYKIIINGQTQTTSLNTMTLNALTAGEYSIHIQAQSEQIYTIESEISNNIIYTVTEKLAEVEIELNTSFLTIHKTQNVYLYEIQIDDIIIYVDAFSQNTKIINIAQIKDISSISQIKVRAMGQGYYLNGNFTQVNLV